MGLSANFSKKQLFKTIKTIVPKGEKMREAFTTAAKFGVKKGASGKLMQGQAVKLMKELKEEHVLKAHPQVGGRQFSTTDETAKHLLADVTAPPVDAAASKAAAEAARREKLVEKQKINEAMKAKTVEEHRLDNVPKEKEPINVAAARGKDTIQASRESAAAVEAEIEKRSGKKTDSVGAFKEKPERGSVALAPSAPAIPKPGTKTPAVSFPQQSPRPVPSSPPENKPEASEALPSPEPAKASDAIDIDIG